MWLYNILGFVFPFLYVLYIETTYNQLPSKVVQFGFFRFLISILRMDKKIVEGDGKNVMDFKSKNILLVGEKSTALSPAPVKKPGTVENKYLESTIACQTPWQDKWAFARYNPGGKAQTSREVGNSMPIFFFSSKLKNPYLNLTSAIFSICRYRKIAELFDHLNFSLRLLGLLKRVATFQNISTQVEVLSKR